MSDVKSLRIGYVSYSPSLNLPGDRRRFARYARMRGIPYELADPGEIYDIVVVSEAADISVWANYPHGRIVYDLIDSYLAIPRDNVKGRLRGLAKFVSRQHRYLQLDHWRAIEKMCRRANAVICTTVEQQRDIEKFCSNVHIILDIHAAVAQRAKTGYKAGAEFRLVWEGLPVTADSLLLIDDALRAVGRTHPVSLHVITDPEYFRFLGKYGRRLVADTLRGLGVPVTLHEWHENTCAEIICACDAALIPLNLQDPFAAGKPENKLLLFWRMGMPAVVAASPAYQRAMTGAGLDLVCRNRDDWQQHIERLITDPALREMAGTRGRAYAETHFSESQLLSRWDAVFETLT